jgi:ATP-dependent DNA ligase
MSKTTLYQKTRLGKIQQWKIWVEKQGKSGHPEVWIEHGLEDGKKQMTHDVISEGVNIGKANETTPLQQATLTMERRITKQKEKGYCDNQEDLDKNLTIDFSQQFPKELCFYKPKNSIDDKKLKKLEDNGQLAFTVKYDGMMHIVRKSSEFGVEIYSRRMDLVTDKYPHLVKAFEKLPNETVLLGEMILADFDNHKEAFNAVSQICRSDPEKAIERQNELGKVSYCIFDVAFKDGKNWLTNMAWLTRWSEARRLEKVCGSKYIIAAEMIKKPHREALEEVKKRKLEGLVVWDKTGIMEDNGAFTMNGKPYRPNVLWKSKPKYEDDFIVRFNPKNEIGEYGKGKNNGKVKSVYLYQLDKNGNEVFLAKCGGGLSDEQRDFYTTAKYPRVWRVEYDSIQPKTGSLRFPVFNADRTLTGDKDIKECLMSEQIIQARGE